MPCTATRFDTQHPYNNLQSALVVFLASTMTPQTLGLPPLAHIVAILAGWGLSAGVTPFSVLSLTASRYARTGLHQISLGANWVFVLCNALVICALMSGYVYMIGMSQYFFAHQSGFTMS